MATRSAIAIREKNGTFTAMYCHYDGCPVNGHGKMLLDHYNTEVDVHNLLGIGNGIRSLKSCVFETKKNILDDEPVAFLANEFCLRYWARTSCCDYIYIWDNGWRFVENDHGAGENEKLIDLQFFLEQYKKKS